MNWSQLQTIIGGMASDGIDAQFRWWFAGFIAGWTICLLNLIIRVLRWAAAPKGGGVKLEL